MRHVAAYMMLVLGGNESPSAADVSSVLESVGAEVNQESLDALISDMEGKSLEEVVAAGQEKIATVSVGGGGGGGSSGGSGGAAAVEEKKEEEEEESAEEMGGMDMFGGGDDGY
eukprot:CAMPEP_0182463512 /NCGR_PEP_ID=MMETSP1319-20130603/7502_1 /TAXON_ID=172717 /ORGANISM="Bolidomonas pacifica, Strain RCC208" /LENGTH=113 /DNA_ID=CAMNT_0024663061 /DNA_START=11 /DNA_END=352 /DNA_ORIENTATION=+